MSKQSIADVVAEEVHQWIEDTATDVADAILGSALEPDVVQPPHAEYVRMMRTLMYLPDGSPNVQGRDKLMARVGPQEYEKIALEVADAGGPLTPPTPVLPPMPMPQSPMGVG